MKLLRHPVRSIREPFGLAGVIVACVALVAALSGGAYAASGGLSGKQKKEVEKIAKKYAGKPGSAGSAGPAGSAGAKGDAGAAGTSGTTGSNGTSVTSAALLPGEDPECEEGGSKFSAANGTTYACNGEQGPQGSPWVAGQAPSEVLLKGTWSIQQFNAAVAEETIFVPLSTGIPISTEAMNGFVVAPTGNGSSLGCAGTAEAPTATVPGRICVYEAAATNLEPANIGNVAPLLSTSGGGALLALHAHEAGAVSGYGTCAVLTK
jgi:hypothetical protein